MSAGLRLASFAAALAVVFGGAVVLGGAVDASAPGGDGAPAAHGAAAMSGHGSAPTAPRGLSVAAAGLRLDLATPALTQDRTGTLRLRILDAHDHAVRGFGVTHTRRMHVIVVRRDLTGFQHLHPRMAADGTWSVPLRVRDAGSYRVFADFATPGGTPVTLASDLRVDGDAVLHGLPAPAVTATAPGGYAVRLTAAPAHAGTEQTLRFTVTRGGRAVRPQPYLGAGGHLVALREGDLAFLHVHPEEHATGDAIAFMTTLPTAGRYRLFLQFKHAGRVHTVAFTREAM